MPKGQKINLEDQSEIGVFNKGYFIGYCQFFQNFIFDFQALKDKFRAVEIMKFLVNSITLFSNNLDVIESILLTLDECKYNHEIDSKGFTWCTISNFSYGFQNNTVFSSAIFFCKMKDCNFDLGHFSKEYLFYLKSDFIYFNDLMSQHALFFQAVLGIPENDLIQRSNKLVASLDQIIQQKYSLLPPSAEGAV